MQNGFLGQPEPLDIWRPCTFEFLGFTQKVLFAPAPKDVLGDLSSPNFQGNVGEAGAIDLDGRPFVADGLVVG